VRVLAAAAALKAAIEAVARRDEAEAPSGASRETQASS